MLAKPPARRLHIDFETRSPVDLKAHGVFVYASHPETEVLCTGYAFDDGEPEIAAWSDMPDEVEEHVRAGGIVVAHNAQFELCIWNLCMGPRWSWPTLTFEQADCTMARAYAMALPGSLENCAAALGLAIQKDMAGNRLMRKLSSPRVDGSFPPYDEQEFKRLWDYCKQDIRVTQQLDKRLLSLTREEKRTWVLDQKINLRGVQCDVTSAEKASKIIELEKDRLNAEMRVTTGNEVATFTANTQLKNWIIQKGVPTDGVAKAEVLRLLSRDDLPTDVRAALQIRQEGAKSSTAKLTAFIARADADDRVRGCYQWHGAATGRFAGRGLQTHNFPREKYPLGIFDCLDDGETLRLCYGSPTSVISKALRGFLMAAAGKTLFAADFNAIEARVVAWLAGEESVLQLFREGKDVYTFAAAVIYGVSPESVTPEQRQIGKVAILALGYQGGVNAFQAMAVGYGIRLAPIAKELWERAPDNRRERAIKAWNERGKSSGIEKLEWIPAELIKLAWREGNPSIVAYWHAVEAGAISAVSKPGSVVRVGTVAFRTSGSFLFCRLPSGRALCYPYPRLKLTTTPWGQERHAIRYKTEDSATHRWIETAAYGGLLVENITQAVARDVLVEAMLRVEEAGFPVVIHVHDELVCEVDDNPLLNRQNFSLFENLVEQSPAWASGLPLKAGGWIGKRYRK